MVKPSACATAAAKHPRIHDVKTKALRLIPDDRGDPVLVQVANLVYHGWKCIGQEVALVVNVPTEPYHYAQPDEYRVEPHGTLPYDWTRKDG